MARDWCSEELAKRDDGLRRQARQPRSAKKRPSRKPQDRTPLMLNRSVCAQNPVNERNRDVSTIGGTARSIRLLSGFSFTIGSEKENGREKLPAAGR
jgi:hypothetical protein